MDREAWQTTVCGRKELDTTEQLIFHFTSLLLSLLGSHIRSLHLRLYSFPANRIISAIFLDSIYMC